jgi:dienelactone hydrolase
MTVTESTVEITTPTGPIRAIVFRPAAVLPYDEAAKPLSSYDSDARAALEYLKGNEGRFTGARAGNPW